VYTDLQSVSGNLQRGQIYHGFRFHDGRKADIVYHGNLIRFQYEKQNYSLSVDDNIIDSQLIVFCEDVS